MRPSDDLPERGCGTAPHAIAAYSPRAPSAGMFALQRPDPVGACASQIRPDRPAIIGCRWKGRKRWSRHRARRTLARMPKSRAGTRIRAEVIRLVALVPKGKFTTYGSLAVHMNVAALHVASV